MVIEATPAPAPAIPASEEINVTSTDSEVEIVTVGDGFRYFASTVFTCYGAGVPRCWALWRNMWSAALVSSFECDTNTTQLWCTGIPSLDQNISDQCLVCSVVAKVLTENTEIVR